MGIQAGSGLKSAPLSSVGLQAMSMQDKSKRGRKDRATYNHFDPVRGGADDLERGRSPSQDHDKKVAALRQQNVEAMQEKTIQAKLDGAELANDAETVIVKAGGMLDVKTSREEAWLLIEKVLGVAFKSYWDLHVPVVRVLLILAPLGYLIAVLMYMWYADSKLTELKKVSDVPQKLVINEFVVKQPQSEKATALPKSAVSREPIWLRYYHFLPLVRYYLIIKDQESEDVEGLFRVNSLSSFTLGTAQLVGILFQQLSGQDMTIFVQINIASQAVNWLITFLYFGTTVSHTMKASTRIDALIYNTDLEMRRQYEGYLEMVRQYSNNPTPENKELLNNYETMVETEISEFTKMPVESLHLGENFGMVEKTMIRKHLRRKLIKGYQDL